MHFKSYPLSHIAICDLENLFYLTRTHSYAFDISKLNSWLTALGVSERLAIGSRIPALEQWVPQFIESGWEVRLVPNKRNFPDGKMRSNADAAICLEIGALIHDEDVTDITIMTCDFALLVDVAWHIREIEELDIELSVLAYPKFKSGMLPTDIKGVGRYTRLDAVMS